jgi:hypothetical protein
MLYRPKFCAECGERIERVEWPLFASRRFCDLCSSVNKGADLLPKAIAAGGILIGLLGVAIGMRPGKPVVDAGQKQARSFATVPAAQNRVPVAPVEQPSSPPATPESLPEQTAAHIAVATPPKPRTIAEQPIIVEEKFFCGAQTKKGAPCSRRVKGPKRCYQHEGMPAMTAQSELRIK